MKPVALSVVRFPVVVRGLDFLFPTTLLDGLVGYLFDKVIVDIGLIRPAITFPPVIDGLDFVGELGLREILAQVELFGVEFLAIGMVGCQFEFIGAAFKASLVVGIAVSMPFVLYQMAMFVAPGLTPTERRYLYALLPISVLMFFAGAAFGYRVLFPPMLNFLLTFGSDVATPMIRIGNYVNTMVTLLFWMGVVFEIPLVSFFLSKIGVVTPEFLAKQRRYAIVAAFVLGAIITPTFDPLNQTFVALPIIVLYEAGIWLAKLARRGKKQPSSELGLADTDGGAQK